MPEEFDPAWEYACSDPEIEEIIYGRQAKRFDGLDLPYDRGVNVGHRFGRVPVIPPRTCEGLDPPYDRNVNAGYRSGRVAVIPPRTCEARGCGQEFSPKWRQQLYCSYACSQIARRSQEKRYGRRQGQRKKITRQGGLPVAVKVGDKVMLEVPDNLQVHKQFAVVKEVTEYGAIVLWRNNTREFRAFPHEMVPVVSTGNQCERCGSSNLVRAGTCLVCQDCGDTSGGCG